MTGPDTRTGLRAARALGLALMGIGLSWAVAVVVFGGFEFTIRGVTITSNEPLRPLAVAAVGLAVRVWIDGAAFWVGRWAWLAARVDERLVVAALTVVVTGVGVVYASTAAEGSDSYGYVSQADLWLEGRLEIDQPWVADVPWPNAKWTFSPLGYRPNEQEGHWTIVPSYSAGLPIMMAVAKRVGGQEAMFWIVPLFGGALVLATYGIGRRLGSPTAGLIGAWLVAASPATLFMLMLPMSDVPVAGAWALSVFFLLGAGSVNALAAGVLAALAVVIRPNLALQTVALGLWYVVRVRGGGMRVAWHGLAFAIGLAPGIAAVALINQHLYGSPWRSGYGSLDTIFAWSNVWPNLRAYSTWLVDTHTPLVLAGVAAIFTPIRWFWPSVPDRRALLIVALFVAANWAVYLVYLPFDVWWYLRFLLPSWPFIMVGFGAASVAVYRTGRPALMLAAVCAVVGVGLMDLRVAARESAFGLWRDRRTASVAREVSGITEANSVVFTMHHSGSLRYYGGRMTMRYDLMDKDWLDRSVVWLAERGVESYALLEEWEVGEFRKRFAGQRAVQSLEMPRLTHRSGRTTRLYRLSESTDGTIEHRTLIERFPPTLRSLPPAPPPGLVFFGKAR